MQISQDKVVTFHYRLREEEGVELENNQDAVPLAYLHGHRNILPGLEEALDGLAADDVVTVTLPPEKAYGPRHPNATQRVPVKHLASKHKRLRPGMLVKVNTENGVKDARVLKVGKFMVDLDLNHPFAGKTLVFEIQIVDVRDATSEEIAHGHAHGEGGHHH
jgi:FKBP-type peptidyl-prolyl cis-trans isomerase SlyD